MCIFFISYYYSYSINNQQLRHTVQQRQRHFHRNVSLFIIFLIRCTTTMFQRRLHQSLHKIILRRGCSTKRDGGVRVRYAPSPTGELHIGGLRTALFNYVFAKQNNGAFVVRIEDTDRKRYVEGSETRLMELLNVCGVEPDESFLHGNSGLTTIWELDV